MGNCSGLSSRPPSCRAVLWQRKAKPPAAAASYRPTPLADTEGTAGHFSLWFQCDATKTDLVREEKQRYHSVAPCSGDSYSLQISSDCGNTVCDISEISTSGRSGWVNGRFSLSSRGWFITLSIIRRTAQPQPWIVFTNLNSRLIDAKPCSFWTSACAKQNKTKQNQRILKPSCLTALEGFRWNNGGLSLTKHISP